VKRSMVLLSFLLYLILGLCCATAESGGISTLQPGATVQFGQYEQDNNTENGREPIEWIVLDVREGKALLLSKQALDCLPFNAAKTDVIWENSSIRAWLNDEFFQAAFAEVEQNAIALTTVSNAAKDGNADYAPADHNPTEDHVFLLSHQEVMNYLPAKNSDRKITGTEYARSRGARFGGFTVIGIGETDWWLRSPGRVIGDSAFVNVYGDVDTKSVDTKQGIRPALWADLTTNASEFPAMQYSIATALSEQGKYQEAADIYESLGNYGRSPDLSKEARYQQAVLVYQAGDYETAIPLLESLDGYRDTHEMCRAARYTKALSYLETGDYTTAAQLFGEVGQYQDSMVKMKTCFEKLGTKVFYFNADAVNAGMDCGYSQNNIIDGNNKHFGWRMGRFFLSGYTQNMNESTESPIFLKTLGDSVTLWFDLEQNIDALNGSTNLIVCEDRNGYDQYFNVPKTNFGKGALIVRHTDHQNSKSDPVIYTDYLLAKGTTGADTKVVLNEEGDYEVALDYELQDNDITHITSKYDNYRIFFKFSIRNGNCMVYPFDVLTRGELQNTAVTENGFYLDLARSRYLDINVKRSVLIEGAGGMVEDERFNRPAKDGDEYTQEGIYTISVKNRYTGESTVKTLFVGTDELLQQYISNGFDKNRLN